MIKVEVFCDEVEILFQKIDALLKLLPENFQVEVVEEMVPYPAEAKDFNLSSSALLKEEIIRLRERAEHPFYHTRYISTESYTEQTKFIELLK